MFSLQILANLKNTFNNNVNLLVVKKNLYFNQATHLNVVLITASPRYEVCPIFLSPQKHFLEFFRLVNSKVPMILSLLDASKPGLESV